MAAPTIDALFADTRQFLLDRGHDDFVARLDRKATEFDTIDAIVRAMAWKANYVMRAGDEVVKLLTAQLQSVPLISEYLKRQVYLFQTEGDLDFSGPQAVYQNPEASKRIFNTCFVDVVEETGNVTFSGYRVTTSGSTETTASAKTTITISQPKGIYINASMFRKYGNYGSDDKAVYDRNHSRLMTYLEHFVPICELMSQLKVNAYRDHFDISDNKINPTVTFNRDLVDKYGVPLNFSQFRSERERGHTFDGDTFVHSLHPLCEGMVAYIRDNAGVYSEVSFESALQQVLGIRGVSHVIRTIGGTIQYADIEADNNYSGLELVHRHSSTQNRTYTQIDISALNHPIIRQPIALAAKEVKVAHDGSVISLLADDTANPILPNPLDKDEPATTDEFVRVGIVDFVKTKQVSSPASEIRFSFRNISPGPQDFFVTIEWKGLGPGMPRTDAEREWMEGPIRFSRTQRGSIWALSGQTVTYPYFPFLVFENDRGVYPGKVNIKATITKPYQREIDVATTTADVANFIFRKGASSGYEFGKVVFHGDSLYFNLVLGAPKFASFPTNVRNLFMNRRNWTRGRGLLYLIKRSSLDYIRRDLVLATKNTNGTANILIKFITKNQPSFEPEITMSSIRIYSKSNQEYVFAEYRFRNLPTSLITSSNAATRFLYSPSLEQFLPIVSETQAPTVDNTYNFSNNVRKRVGRYVFFDDDPF